MKTSILLLAALYFATPVANVLAEESARPNILYFYVDDMGWGSIGPNGQAARKSKDLPYVRTPNLDALARRGVNFVRGYGCHVCSPARSSQQSGFHQGHTFADRNDPDNAKKAMRADDVLMGDALSAAGYATGYWGKWGYGGSKDKANPVIENIQTLPTSHGYQHVLAELHHVRAHTFFQPTLWRAPARAGAIGGLELVPNSLGSYQDNTNYPSSPALQNDPAYPKVAYCDDAYAFAALDFVRAQGQQYHESGKPFFGLLAVQIPHAPFGEITSLPDWERAYAQDKHFQTLADQTRQWAAMVTRIDAHFGNILAALEDPNNDGDQSDSVADNTLVVFQSDNGGPAGKNNVELDANGGLRGNKGKIQEGGIRVPLVMRWPAKINSRSQLKAGSNHHRVVDVTDLLPTFCELAGASTPLGIDGVSIAPTLLGKTEDQRPRDFIIHEAGNGNSIIRGAHKLVLSKKSLPQLYNLDDDHSEEHNLAEEYPAFMEELETLLLGERVAEPKGFANTYHHWTGRDGASTSDPDHWSDYQYANAGVTYMTDTGRPQLSWVARIENQGNGRNQARADEDLEFLGLEIRGAGAHAVQQLVLDPDVKLTGRNEVRIAAHGTLVLQNSTVNSLRWVDVLAQGRLRGSGTIDATVYNQGMIAVGASDQANLNVNGDFHHFSNGDLQISLAGATSSGLNVAGEARLAGKLTIQAGRESKPTRGQSYEILTAEKIVGTFSNDNDLRSADGTRFSVDYEETAVVISVK